MATTPAVGSGIFISYRRDDTRQAAGRLGDDLVREFGAERIFRDIERIELGLEFEQVLNQALNNCNVMLVLIGPHWLTVADAKGARRLDQPADWIRTEIATALQRKVRVVPVLVDGAALPAEADLPENLRPLVRRQAFEIEDGRWHSDVRRLVDGLSRLEGLALAKSLAPVPLAVPPQPAAPATARGSRNKLIGAGVGLLVLLAVAGSLLWGGADTPAPAAMTTAPAADSPLPAAVAAAPLSPAGSVVDTIAGVWRSDVDEVFEFTKGEPDALWVRRTKVVVDGKELPAATRRQQVALSGRVVDIKLDYGKEQWSCAFTLAASGQSMQGPCIEERTKKSTHEQWNRQQKPKS